MRLCLSKVPTAQKEGQLQQLAKILRFGGAADMRVTVSAEMAASSAAVLPMKFTAVPEWSRGAKGMILFSSLLNSFRKGNLMSADFGTRLDINIMLSPDRVRPFYDWDGRWANTFQLLLKHPAGAPTAKPAERLVELAAGKYRQSELFDGGVKFVVHGLSAISRDNVLPLLEWLDATFELKRAQIARASLCGPLNSLPGFDESSDCGDLALEPHVTFGEAARDTCTLNQQVDWARKFGSAVHSIAESSLYKLLVMRRYMHWKTRTGVEARGTSQNAVWLEADYSTSALNVEFEQFSHADPKAAELKGVFGSFWAEVDK